MNDMHICFSFHEVNAIPLLFGRLLFFVIASVTSYVRTLFSFVFQTSTVRACESRINIQFYIHYIKVTISEKENL